MTDDVFTEDDVANANDRMRQEAASPDRAGLLREALERIAKLHHDSLHSRAITFAECDWHACTLAKDALAATGDSEGRKNVEPQWEACKVCGGDHWTKEHDHRYPPERQMSVGDSEGPLDVERLARALSNAAEARQPTISADYRAKAEKVAAEYARLSSKEAGG